MAFPPLGNSDHVVLLVSIGFPSNSLEDAPFHSITCDYILLLIRIIFKIIWQMFLRRISLNAVLLLLLVNFVSGFNLELMYIILILSIRLRYLAPSSWFSAAFSAARVHRNHFFCLLQQNKPSESKIKFQQANNHCKRVLEAAKLAYANKIKNFTSQKLGSQGIWRIANIVLYSMVQSCCILHLVKQIYVLKAFLITLSMKFIT